MQLRHQAKDRAIALQRREDGGTPDKELPFLAAGQEHWKEHQHQKLRQIHSHHRNTKLISAFYHIIAIRCRP